MGLTDEVKHLKTRIKEKDEKIEEKRRINDIERCTQMEDLIITGLETKHQKYARAASVTDKGELQTREQLLRFLKGKTCPLKAQAWINTNNQKLFVLLRGTEVINRQ